MWRAWPGLAQSVTLTGQLSSDQEHALMYQAASAELPYTGAVDFLCPDHLLLLTGIERQGPAGLCLSLSLSKSRPANLSVYRASLYIEQVSKLLNWVSRSVCVVLVFSLTVLGDLGAGPLMARSIDDGRNETRECEKRVFEERPSEEIYSTFPPSHGSHLNKKDGKYVDSLFYNKHN